MPGKITEAHSRQVEMVLDQVPGAKEKGFWQTHRSLCDRLGLGPYEQSFRPDAYRINEVASEIEIYEVEVRSKLSAAKVAMLGDMWAWWDGEEEDWLPVLFVVDRFGNIARMDLMHAALGTGWAA